ncbi:hypothetical protein AB6A40_000948 [Gnathostoma spinigerum]|uniref:Uncharacterized protein n=1 Tax=Gnathostoma spinigerum TaxID=75299 RepID=A0ABD6EA54_9BILA
MLLILLLLQTQYCSARGFPDVTIFNEDEARSRLLMLDGHMYFHAGKSKNITFIAGAGGSIFLGDKDLSLIAELVSETVLAKFV